MIAMFLQYLSIKCGIATNRDLAQACRDSYPPKLVAFLWIVMEVAIAATDLAEVIGSAVALKLLFNLPLIAGVCITACDVLLLMLIGQGSNRFRILEAFVGVLVLLITTCFAAEVGLSKPEAVPLLAGFIPDTSLFENSSKLFIAAGIIGATVMPHNIFLHSSIVLTRNTHRDEESMTKAIRYSTIDCNVSLSVAWFVNSAILIVAASAFHAHGYKSVATLEEASSLLDPILGSKAASILFGVALLGSGQNSTLTGRSTSTLNTGVRLICRIMIFCRYSVRPNSYGGVPKLEDQTSISAVNNPPCCYRSSSYCHFSRRRQVHERLINNLASCVMLRVAIRYISTGAHNIESFTNG
jgi:manganese transport protein